MDLDRADVAVVMRGRSTGRPPIKRRAAATWLAQQSWFARWTMVPDYLDQRREWKQIADAVRDNGFFSQRTGTLDVPVVRIVTEAIALRDLISAGRCA